MIKCDLHIILCGKIAEKEKVEGVGCHITVKERNLVVLMMMMVVEAMSAPLLLVPHEMKWEEYKNKDIAAVKTEKNSRWVVNRSICSEFPIQ